MESNSLDVENQKEFSLFLESNSLDVENQKELSFFWKVTVLMLKIKRSFPFLNALIFIFLFLRKNNITSLIEKSKFYYAASSLLFNVA